MPPSFVNRSEELSRIQRAFESDSAEFIVVLGRRRIGKSPRSARRMLDVATDLCARFWNGFRP